MVLQGGDDMASRKTLPKTLITGISTPIKLGAEMVVSAAIEIRRGQFILRDGQHRRLTLRINSADDSEINSADDSEIEVKPEGSA
jgi:hypothetical protein